MPKLPLIAFLAVMICWVVFAATFFLRKKPPQAPAAKKAPISMLGIVLQGVGYAIVWMLQRPHFSFMFPDHPLLGVVLSFLAVGLAAGALVVVRSAIATLGKQWAFSARLVEEHLLITDGPYRYVRHPIYTGMLGMLLATALVISHWIALAPALVVFGIGTYIRVRAEERLLGEAFGEQFTAYKERVAAVVPGLL